jgi:hypothetical protein
VQFLVYMAVKCETTDGSGAGNQVLLSGAKALPNTAESLSEIVTRPYQGAKEDGAAGAMKDFAKGTLEFGTKVRSGWFALLFRSKMEENEH